MYIIYSGNKPDQLAAHRVCIGLGDHVIVYLVIVYDLIRVYALCNNCATFCKIGAKRLCSLMYVL